MSNTITAKVAQLNELFESFGFDNDSAGAEAEVEYVRLEEDGDTWPIADWQVEAELEDGETILHEISVSIWSASPNQDSAVAEAVETFLAKIKEIGLVIENAGTKDSMRSDDEHMLEARRFWLK